MDRIDFSAVGALSLVHFDGVLAYLGICDEPDTKVLCVTYSTNDLKIGNTVIVTGSYRKMAPNFVILDTVPYQPTGAIDQRRSNLAQSSAATPASPAKVRNGSGGEICGLSGMSGSPRKAALELRSHEVTAFAAVGSGKSGLDNLADMQELDDSPGPIAPPAGQFPRQRSSQLQEHQVHGLGRHFEQFRA